MCLDIVGVSAARWAGSGKVMTGDVVLYYSGGDKQQHRVGILIRKDMSEEVSSCWQQSSRVRLLNSDTGPVPLNIIKVYAPTTAHSDELLDEFYEQFEEALRQCKPNEITLVMGYLNDKVGEGRSGEVVGDFGLGEEMKEETN